MAHDYANRVSREAATAWNFAGWVQKARAQPNLLRAQCQHTFYADRFPVPKTLRKRGLRNPTTAAFCLRENGCSEYTDLRNTLLPGPAWNPEGGPITGGAGWSRAAAIGGIRPHYLICREKQKAATARQGWNGDGFSQYETTDMSPSTWPRPKTYSYRKKPPLG
jgi:hypothetical protein